MLFREAVVAFPGVGGEGKCGEKDKAFCRAQYGDYYEWACKNCEKRQGKD